MSDFGKISPTFKTWSGKFAFQKVGMMYRVYDGGTGEFLMEFRSFWSMCAFIVKNGGQ